VKVTITIPSELVSAVDALAEWTRQSRSSLVSLALVKLLHDHGVAVRRPLETSPGDCRDISSLSSSSSLKSLRGEEGREPAQEPSEQCALFSLEVDPVVKRTPSRGALTKSAEQAFEEWWGKRGEGPPRKRGKGAARKAYGRALRYLGWTGARDAEGLAAAKNILMVGRDRWAEEVRRLGTEEEFVVHPARWLNEHRWEDEESECRSLVTASVSDRSKRERIERAERNLETLQEKIDDGEALNERELQEFKRLRGIVDPEGVRS